MLSMTFGERIVALRKKQKWSLDELGVTIDYLIGGSNTIFDKDLLKRIEDIENLSEEDRQQVYYVLDTTLSYHKTKQTFATK